MSYVVAVDSGGTFTDCVVLDERGGVTRAKAPSTPPDFERGVFNAVEAAADHFGVSLSQLLGTTSIFAHGTTVATNILLTRTGARTALITTNGHEDAIFIGRTAQKVAGLTETEIINVAELSKAEPLVPRSRTYGLDERVDRAGNVVVGLNESRLDELIDQLVAHEVDAVAVSLLWSFMNPEHEQRVKARLQERSAADGSGWFVTTSSELAPVIREYERTATTALNAYLTPGVHGYLDRMREGLRAAGHQGPVTVMHSAGGVSSIDDARERGVGLLSSGPAGGMLGTRALAEQLELDKVIATDVGGTSFDIGLVVDGEPSYADAPVFSQYPVALPVIDVPSIGTGGGSIAWIEPDTGVLKVGPQSAGASPGPACYGEGGTEPTVTDANVALGRINPTYFLGGKIHLDVERARQAITKRIANPLGMDPVEAAAAIVDIADAQMSDLIRKVTVERGLDPARFAVFGYGGAAGLHVSAYAGKLGCRHVVIPRAAAVFSAYGIGVSDVKRVAVVSDPMEAPFDLRRWARRFDELAEQLVVDLETDGLPTADLAVRRFVELQFRGQVHTVRVPIAPEDLEVDDGGEVIIDRFTQLYEAKFGAGTAYRKAGVETMTFVVEGTARLPLPAAEPEPLGDPSADVAVVGQRPIYLTETRETVATDVFDAARLRPGHEIAGPAVIDAVDTTVTVRTGDRVWVDGLSNLRLELASGSR